MLEKVMDIIERRVRPKLMEHEGDVRVLSIDDGICKVQLTGKCAGCPSAFLTTEELIEAEIKAECPEIRQVVLVDNTSEELIVFAKKILSHK